MKDCLFCKIVAEEIPSIKVYEDEDFLGFLNITPVSLGHTLIIPKEHSRNIFDMKEKELQEITPVLKKISVAVKNATNADGINIHMNNEPAAGQIIFHSHMHVIPRFEDDNLQMWHGHTTETKDLKKVGEKIAKEIKLNL